MRKDRLRIANFAQIGRVELELGDLTVLVGAQATGKSLVLQWLKLALDGRKIVEALRDAGHSTDQPEVLVDLVFGTGMGAAWQKGSSEVVFNGRRLTPEGLGRLGQRRERVFFVLSRRTAPS